MDVRHVLLLGSHSVRSFEAGGSIYLLVMFFGQLPEREHQVIVLLGQGLRLPLRTLCMYSGTALNRYSRATVAT